MIKPVILFIASLVLSPLRAQNPEHISFVHIGVNEGLSQSTVFDIAQDLQGNMWFATYDGLNKYDGYDFTVYQHNEEDPNSIGSDIIRACTVDSQGRMWIGTEEGLSLYDADRDAFHNFTYRREGKKPGVNAIVEADGRQLLLFTNRNEGLFLFDTETQKFSDSPLHPALASVSPTFIGRQGDYIYIGSFEGVFAYSVSRKTVENIAPEKLRGKQILSVLRQSPVCLWVGTEGHGLFKVNPQTKEVSNYTHIPGEKNGISSNYIRSLTLDSQNLLWIGTINSLNIYNEADDSFRSYTSDLQKSGSLSQTSVRDIFMDSQGGMWLGTYYGGLNYYHPLKNRFHNIQFVAKENSLNCNTIGCIAEDSRQNIWIGTNSGGLNRYNPRSGIFTHYTQREGLVSDDIKSIYIDESRDMVYIGTHTGGLSILHRSTGHIETVYNDRIRNIYDIEPTLGGELWLTGMTTLVRYNPRSKTYVNVDTQLNGQPLVHDQFTNLLRDSKRRLWIGGERGISVYTEKDNGLSACPVLPAGASAGHKTVNCIYEARNGIFWIGTRSGLYRFDEKKKEIRQYTTLHGLPNNVIHGILEDATGKLWISTNKGLSSLQPETEKFRNYTDNDGLQSNQFTNNAYCQAVDGQMYFGGIDGITTFHPEQIVDNPYTPPAVITGLRLFNRKVLPGDDTGILKENICETRSITLAAGQSMFSLEFTVSNYISGNHNTFAYMLEGYDREWYRTETQRTVSYSNLPAGTYRFLVKAANSDGKWNETPTELEITVLPVWYRTWWALLLFAAAFIAITVFIFRYFWMRKSMQAELQMERVDKQRQKEVNEMKLRFFINISHELRTPLTLILAPVQEMLDKVSDRWMHRQLEHVQKNTNRLLHLVNQLMDYRRAELGVFGLRVRRNPIHKVIEKDFLFYDRLAQRKRIAYDFTSEVEGKEILCDPDYLELIVNNLLSNAFKYTGEGESITVTLKEEGSELLLQVKDTGSGIPVDKQAKVFERFYQVDNEHMGSGIGLSLVQRLVELHHGRIELESREGEGSAFSIYLPTEEAAYRPEELAGSTDTDTGQQAYTTNRRDMYIVDTEGEKTEEEEEGGEEKPKKEEAATDDGGQQKERKEQKEQKEKILVVEDNPDIRQYLCEELGKSYRVLTAGNGEEALAVLKEQEADLIITDVMMPVMDGLQLCKQIKQNLRTCHIPIIMLSAKTDLKEQLEGLQVGADDYIPKPFSMAVITAKIKNLFRTRYRAIEHYTNSLEMEPEKMALNPLDEELLKKAVAIVEKNMDNVEFSTDDFAREMCMSRSNLHIKMKALTGEPTNDFIRKIRFNRACKLLKEGRYTVSEISSMVGFNTPSYFATSFKKYFGCLPSEYGK